MAKNIAVDRFDSLNSQERHEFLLNCLSLVSYDSRDGDGKIVISGALQNITPFAGKELALDIDEFYSHIHPLDRKNFLMVLKTSAKSLKYSAVYRLRQKDGTYKHILDEGVFLSGMQGRRVGILKDISGIYAYESLLKNSIAEIKTDYDLQKNIIDSGLVWITLADMNSRIIIWNRGAESISGYSQKEVSGRSTIWKWLYPGERERKKFIRALKAETDPSGEHETVIQCKDKAIKTISWNSNIIYNPDNKPIGAIIVGVDITPLKEAEKIIADEKNNLVKKNMQLKKAQKELENLNESLEHKVKKRTRQLELAKEKIQASLDMKTKFINQIAHDIRTPLTPVNLLVPTLTARTKRDKEKIEVIKGNVSYLNQIMNDLLTISRLEYGTLEFKFDPVNIHEVVNSVISNNRVVFQKENIHVVNSVRKGLPMVWAAKLRITEVLQNLIANSIKFMKPEKKGRSLVFSAEKSGGFIEVTVRDTGIGIDRDNLPRISEEFYKVDQSRHEHSAGLGLSICKRIVEKHGGKMRIESPGKNKGTSISFSVPVFKNQKP